MTSTVQWPAAGVGDVAGVVLAAGAGRRLGMPKALVRVGGVPLVERTARMLGDAGCDPVVVILGAAADDVVGSCDLSFAQSVRNDDWATGMASSLRVGLEAAGASTASAAVVALVDQPRIGADVVRRLCDRWRGGSLVAAASYGGRIGNPVLFARSVWPQIMETISGDEGARGWLQANRDAVAAVACDDIADPMDIDTLADLQAIDGLQA